jgi:hypothetical protein
MKATIKVNEAKKQLKMMAMVRTTSQMMFSKTLKSLMVLTSWKT